MKFSVPRAGTITAASAVLIVAVPLITTLVDTVGLLQGALIAIVLGVYAVLCAVTILLGRNEIEVPESLFMLTPVPLVIVGVTGLLLSGWSLETVFGIGFEFGTAGSYVLALLAFWLGSLVAHRIGIVVWIVCIIGVCSLGAGVFSELYGAQSLRERPSLEQTMNVIGHQYEQSLRGTLMGSGTTALPQAWSKHRSIELNATQWWNVGPTVTYSDATTVALTNGLLGLLALSLFPILVFTLFLTTPISTGSFNGGFFAVGALAFVSFLLTFLFPIGIGVFVMGALYCGLALACATPDAKKFVPSHQVHMLLVVTVCIIGFGLIGVGIMQSAAARHFSIAKAQVLSDIKSAVFPLGTAATEWPVSHYEIHAAQAMMSAGILIAQEQKNEGEVDIELLGEYITEAMRLTGDATTYNPRNPNVDVMLSRAALYALIYTTGFTTIANQEGQHDTAELTRLFLERAAKLDPTRADIAFSQAVFEKIAGDHAAARSFVQKSLLLKPDYVEARAFLNALPTK